jgi:hypothetical protein
MLAMHTLLDESLSLEKVISDSDFPINTYMHSLLDKVFYPLREGKCEQFRCRSQTQNPEHQRVVDEASFMPSSLNPDP